MRSQKKQHKDVKLNKGEKWMNHVKYSGHTLQKKELIFFNVSTQPGIEMNKKPNKFILHLLRVTLNNKTKFC